MKTEKNSKMTNVDLVLRSGQSISVTRTLQFESACPKTEDKAKAGSLSRPITSYHVQKNVEKQMFICGIACLHPTAALIASPQVARSGAQVVYLGHSQQR